MQACSSTWCTCLCRPVRQKERSILQIALILFWSRTSLSRKAAASNENKRTQMRLCTLHVLRSASKLRLRFDNCQETISALWAWTQAAELAKHALKLLLSSVLSKLRPMKTNLLTRFSVSPQGLPMPAALLPNDSSMCTPWKKYLQSTYMH